MIKHKTIIIQISLIILVIICILGNIITVSDKVSELCPWLGYVFYGALFAITVVFLLWPTLKIIFTPELEPCGEMISEEDRDKADRMVKKSAQNFFILTSVSQNSCPCKLEYG